MKKETSWQQDLRNRQIEPSVEAWNKVSNALHQKELTNNRKKFIIWIAAACICGILIYPFLFSDATKEVTTPLVSSPESKEVVTPKLSNEALSNETQGQEKVTTNVVSTNAHDKVTTQVVAQENNTLKLKTNDKKTTPYLKTETDFTQEVETYLSLVASSTSTPTNKGNINRKAEQLLMELASETPSISQEEYEMNYLLAKVELQLNSTSTEKLIEFAKAQDLLADAETSLEKEDLKRKIWKFIKSSYENLETTLVSLK